MSRLEGWGAILNSAVAHYFEKDGRSLCGRWLGINPVWETVQTLGEKATNGTCRSCWTKRAKMEKQT